MTKARFQLQYLVGAALLSSVTALAGCVPDTPPVTRTTTTQERTTTTPALSSAPSYQSTTTTTTRQVQP